MTFEYILNERERKSEAIGFEKGRSEGEAIVLEKGAAQKQREIAKNMKTKNISVADIAEMTGLPAEEIEKL